MNEIDVVGMFCHIPKGDCDWYQGRVVDVLPDGSFVVQLYSWLTGASTKTKVFPPSTLDGSPLYSDHSEWVQTGDAIMKQSSDEFRGMQ